LRNQCNMIIGASFSQSSRIDQNGEALIIRHLARCCSSFMDVGANKGEWSDVALAAGFLRGYVVEPNPVAYCWLTERYKDRHEIIVAPWLLADAVYTAKYYYDSRFDVYAGMFLKRENAVEITTTTLDEHITDIDLLKIDAEGSECAILKGAQKLLSAGAVRFIQFEYNSAWLAGAGTLTWALRTLEKYKYTTFLIRKNGLYRVAHEYYGEHHGYANYLAVREEHLTEVESLVVGHMP
jgi:FkbM family methyltransferase